MEAKKHFKLYKDGKRWCCAAITTFALGLGLTFMNSTTVLADTTLNSEANSVIEKSTSNNSLTQSTDKNSEIQTGNSQGSLVNSVSQQNGGGR